MVNDTPSYQYTSPHQIWDSYLINVSYMLGTISFLKLGHRSRSRSQCPERVYDTHTTVEIPTSKHRVASTPELATNFIDYKQMAGMTTVRKSCYYAVLSRRYALRWIYFYLNIFIFEIYTQQ